MARKLPLCLLLLLLLPVSCVRENAHSADNVQISVPYDVDTLDPHAKNTLSNFAIVSNFYESLVTTDAGMRIVPCLARLWENPDQDTWVFYLAEDVHFHSGKKLTAEDVVFSFQRLLTEKNLEITGYLQGIRDVSAKGTYTVQIRTTRPSMVFLNKIRFVPIVPAGSTDASLRDHVDGTGPFRLTGWKERSWIEMTRNESYWGRKPAVRTATFHLDRSADQALSDLASGKFDLVQCNKRLLDTAVPRNDDFRISRSDSLFLKYLSYDVARDKTPFCSVEPNPFRNRLVRQALNAAIDRRAIADGLPTYAVPATQLVPPFIFGYNPAISLPAHDPAAAKALLKQAGYPDGFHVTLHARAMFQDAALLVRDQLREIGIDVEAKVLPDREFFDALDRRDVTLYVSRLGCPTGDMSDILDNSLHSINPERHFGWHNYGGYSNAEVDRLIEESNEMNRIEARKNSLQKIMSLLMEDLVWIPLYVDQDVYAVRKDLHWNPRNDSFILAAEIGLK